MERVAIIGAGLAGLTAAQRLQAHGLSVTLFEKSRGLGGRLATRRRELADGAPLSFDHGAQFFTVRDPDFAILLQTLTLGGEVSEWTPRVSDSGAACGGDWWVATPGMSALVKSWTRDLDIRTGLRAVSLDRRDGAWSIDCENGGGADGFDRVILAVPVTQAIDLLPPQALSARRQLSQVRVAPCWAGLFAFETPLSTPFDVWRLQGPVLSWIARNGSKAGRPAADCWVVHATPEWSSDNLERSPEEVLPKLQHAFAEVAGAFPCAPGYAEAHRWRYARTTVPLGRQHVSDCDGTLLIGGDWCLGGRVENAFRSGLSIAREVLTPTAGSTAAKSA